MDLENTELELYKEAIQFSRDMIFWVGEGGYVCACNIAFSEFFKQQKVMTCRIPCEGNKEYCFCNNVNIKHFDQLFVKNDWKEFFYDLTPEPALYETVYKNINGDLMPVEFYASKMIKMNRALIVAKDITERKLYEFKIKTIADEVMRSNRDLQEFAYIASHDLKEPLRKISMFSNKILENFDKEDNNYNFLKKVESCAIRMQNMIDSILEYSRVGTSGEDFSCHKIKNIIDHSVDNCEASLNECNGNIIIENISDTDCACVDANQIHQVFQNLISNSIKFRRKDVPLEIKIEKKEIYDERVVLTIEDNGIGIKEDYLDQIFMPFKKLQSRSEYNGHGMGLAVCKKIIERHGGTISAQSKENEWTRFEFDIPLCKPNN